MSTWHSEKRFSRLSRVCVSLFNVPVVYYVQAASALLLCGSLIVHAQRAGWWGHVVATQRNIAANMAEATRQTRLAEHVETVLRQRTNQRKSCDSLARREPEPYTHKYKNQKIDLDGPVYAFHNWEGVTPQIKIEKHQIDIQKTETLPDYRLIYKIYDGRLYLYESNDGYTRVFNGTNEGLRHRCNQTQQLIMLAMEVYDLPDMDFVVVLGDAPDIYHKFDFPLPHLAYCIRYGSHASPGFTLPAFSAYKKAMGEHQMEFYRECLNQRYPLENRIRKAVWRGSPKGSQIKNPQDVMKNRRVSLAFLGRHMPDLFDAGLSGYTQMNKSNAEMMHLMTSVAPVQSFLPMEGFNNYTAVIDLDGNTWSERLASLLVANTPVLKQEYSRWIEYYGHLLKDDVHVKYFKTDLSDLPSLAAQMMNAETFSGAAAKERLRNQFEFAKEHLSQLGVIRAMAYGLLKMHSYTTWKVEMEEGYRQIPGNMCCGSNNGLPLELVSKINARHS